MRTSKAGAAFPRLLDIISPASPPRGLRAPARRPVASADDALRQGRKDRLNLGPDSGPVASSSLRGGLHDEERVWGNRGYGRAADDVSGHGATDGQFGDRRRVDGRDRAAAPAAE